MDALPTLPKSDFDAYPDGFYEWLERDSVAYREWFDVFAKLFFGIAVSAAKKEVQNGKEK